MRRSLNKIAILAVSLCVFGVSTSPAGDKSATDNETLAKNLSTCDTLDLVVFTNQKWDRLHEFYSKDIKVNWPDGHHTVGIEKHVEYLKAMFVYAPDTRIKRHSIRFGNSTGEWTAVTGVMEGTFSKPMPIGKGKFIKPTGKTFKLTMYAIAHWKDGVIIEESLFWDNLTFMKQMGLGQKLKKLRSFPINVLKCKRGDWFIAFL